MRRVERAYLALCVVRESEAHGRAPQRKLTVGEGVVKERREVEIDERIEVVHVPAADPGETGRDQSGGGANGQQPQRERASAGFGEDPGPS